MKKRTPLNRESFTEFLGTCFSCWFLAVGICLLIDAQFLEEFGVSVIICQCLIAIVLCAVFTRKWWIPVAIIIGPLAIFGLLSLVSKDFSAYGVVCFKRLIHHDMSKSLKTYKATKQKGDPHEQTENNRPV